MQIEAMMRGSLPNCCLKLTACGTLAARQTSTALARRSLTMR
jgi:hypothetical protein